MYYGTINYGVKESNFNIIYEYCAENLIKVVIDITSNKSILIIINIIKNRSYIFFFCG
jgi:hypothetical protein